MNFSKPIILKTIIVLLLTLTSTILVAQKSVTWVGGTPGNETSWDEPKNWSDYHIPNEFSNIYIPDVSTSTFPNPTIHSGIIELNSLQVEPSAKLTIEKKAKLIVYGNTDGFYANNFDIKGSFIVLDEIRDMEIDIKIALSKN